jgi:hypothetical protein
VEVYLDVEGDLTLKTFRPATRRVTWWYIGRWLAIGAIILLATSAFLWFQEGLTSTVAILTEVGLGWSLGLAFFVLAAPTRGRNQALGEGHFHFVASEDGYLVEGPFGTQNFRWAVYKKAYVDSHFIYLFLSSRLAQVLPLQLVPNPQPFVNHPNKLGLMRRTPRTFLLF